MSISPAHTLRHEIENHWKAERRLCSFSPQKFKCVYMLLAKVKSFTHKHYPNNTSRTTRTFRQLLQQTPLIIFSVTLLYFCNYVCVGGVNLRLKLCKHTSRDVFRNLGSKGKGRREKQTKSIFNTFPCALCASHHYEASILCHPTHQFRHTLTYGAPERWNGQNSRSKPQKWFQFWKDSGFPLD